MPVYDYQCGSCGTSFTKKSMISERKIPEETPCESCGETKVRQVVGSPLICYSQPGVLRTSDNFNDRLKEMKRNVGKDTTIGDSIR